MMPGGGYMYGIAAANCLDYVFTTLVSLCPSCTATHAHVLVQVRAQKVL